MTDLEIVRAFMTSVWKDSVVNQDEEGIHVRGYTIWKDKNTYRLQKMVYCAGSREEPPSEDVEDLVDSYPHLHSMVKAIVIYEIDEIFQNVSEGVFFQQEQELEDAQSVVEG